MKKNTAIARFAILVFTWMCSLPLMAQEENCLLYTSDAADE